MLHHVHQLTVCLGADEQTVKSFTVKLKQEVIRCHKSAIQLRGAVESDANYLYVCH